MLVGERGFEPPTPWSRTRCSTRLSHSPTCLERRRALLLRDSDEGAAAWIAAAGMLRDFHYNRRFSWKLGQPPCMQRVIRPRSRHRAVHERTGTHYADTVTRNASKKKNKPAKGKSSGMFARIGVKVRKIPRGKVATYGAVARAAGYPGASRQVVWALRALDGLPWHRVLGAGGKILLPGENGMEQRLRLEMEGVTFVNGKAAMKTHEFRFSR